MHITGVSPGDLVLMRNTAIEDHLNRKLKPRWLGPLIVIKQSVGGSYLLAEMDGTMLKFRVIPYFARERITLNKRITAIIDLSLKGNLTLKGEARRLHY